MAAPRITFPDAEMQMAAWLREALVPRYPGIYVGRNQPPDKKPRPFLVLIRRQGGNLVGRLLDNPRLGITVWGPNDADSNRLAGDVVVALSHLEMTSRLPRLSVSGPSEITVPDSDLSRRFLSVSYLARGTQESPADPAPAAGM